MRLLLNDPQSAGKRLRPRSDSSPTWSNLFQQCLCFAALLKSWTFKNTTPSEVPGSDGVALAAVIPED